MRKILTTGAAAAVLLGVVAVPSASAAPVDPPVYKASSVQPDVITSSDQVVDQSLAQYTPAEAGKIDKKITVGQFTKIWATLKAKPDAAAFHGPKNPDAATSAATVSTLAALDEAGDSDFGYQVGAAGATTARIVHSWGTQCGDRWGGVTKFNWAFDDIIVHNSTGYHGYTQPHGGTGWFVARSSATRYAWNMMYLSYNNLYIWSHQKPNGAPTSILGGIGGSGRVFNNADGVSGIHQGRLGTGSTWWTAQNILDPHTTVSWFRGQVNSVTNEPVMLMYFSPNSAGAESSDKQQVWGSMADNTRGGCA